MNKDLYRVSMPLNAEVKLYTPNECISAIIAAHDSSSGLNGFEPSYREEAVIANALRSDDYDYCIRHAGFSKSTMSEYKAFKEEFLDTDWVEWWDLNWGESASELAFGEPQIYGRKELHMSTDANVIRGDYTFHDIEDKVIELADLLGGYVGEENLLGELDWIINEVKERNNLKKQNSILDPKGRVVLAEFENDALVLTHPNSPEPYVIAHGYDSETGEWSYGSYFRDLGRAYKEFHSWVKSKQPTNNLSERAIVAAKNFLEGRGHEILETSWECGAGTIDLISKDENTLCFSTVMVCDQGHDGFPDEELDREQLEKIAQAFLEERDGFLECQVRFDCISLIVAGASKAFLRHHINCFGSSDDQKSFGAIDADLIKNVISFLLGDGKYKDDWTAEIKELNKVLSQIEIIE